MTLHPNLTLESARDWLLDARADDGGWSDGLTARSSPGLTADVLLGLWAAGVDITALDPNPLIELKNYAAQNQAQLNAAQVAKFILIALISGDNPADFGRLDLPALLSADESGLIGKSLHEHCWVGLALNALNQPLDDALIAPIVSRQNDDGGWDFFGDGEASNTNTSALCLLILAQTRESEAIQRGLDYLGDLQNPDSGWTFQKPSDFGTDTDAYSTAWVILALRATEQDLTAWGDPLGTLQLFQRDDGAFYYDKTIDTPIEATAAALLALSEKQLTEIE